MRPDYDKWMIGIASAVAERSRDPSTKVGCVITRTDKSVASVGYNGFPRAMPDQDEWYEDRLEKYDRIVHSEMNAIIAAKEDITGYTAFITNPPCKDCAKHLIAAGISRVVYPKPTPEFMERWGSNLERARQLFSDSGVAWKEMD